MWSWFTFFLLLHIMTAIAAFGPIYAFPFISGFAQKDPRNALVVSEILERIEAKITIPGPWPCRSSARPSSTSGTSTCGARRGC